MAFIRRFVVLSPDQLLVVSLWIIHTHAVDVVDETPYLSVTSPERRCGKTRLLEVIELLILKPWLCILPSEASVYRRINKEHSTLMLDEVDTIYGKRTKDKYEGLRALLDSGSRRGVHVTRAIGRTNKLESFDVFGPKVLAGIGVLPDTIADRSIPIRLARRTRQEPIERFRRRQVMAAVGSMRDQIEAWTSDHLASLDGAQPEMPDELNDRAQDACECLVAIADELGVGSEARAALVRLFSGDRADDAESMRILLLRDLRTLFEARGAQALPTEGIDGVLAGLWAMTESPWSTWYGRTFDSRDLAGLLAHFEIGPKVVRVGKKRTARGYHVRELSRVWDRYLD
jgi:hypothetical protein